MTYREYIQSIDDELVKMRVIAELARDYPEYDKLPRWRQKEICKRILDAEIPITVLKGV